MGIYAGEPEPAQKANTHADLPRIILIASPYSMIGKQP
jgi:hypothetical protein